MGSYTLDVAWRQILGLQLTEEEIPVFERNVATWIEGIVSLRVLLKINVKGSPGYEARQRVIEKVEERIDQLLEDGPDGKSTLSGMVFATDADGDGDEGRSTTQSPIGSKKSAAAAVKKRLSRKEISDNALILIVAGS